MERIKQQVTKKFAQKDYNRDLQIDVLSTDSRIHSILEEASGHDLIIMNAVGQGRLNRVFFGSLAEDVAQRVDATMLLVRAGTESNVFAAWTEPI